MLGYQRQQLRCLKCQALFEEQTPTGVAYSAWVGFIKSLRCPPVRSQQPGNRAHPEPLAPGRSRLRPRHQL